MSDFHDMQVTPLDKAIDDAIARVNAQYLAEHQTPAAAALDRQRKIDRAYRGLRVAIRECLSAGIAREAIVDETLETLGEDR